VTDLVKTLRTAPIALLALVLAAALVGTSCSSVDPVALQVGQWQLSSKDFEDQLENYASVYEAVTGSDEALRGPNEATWSTDFTSSLLNEQLISQLSIIAAQQRSLEVTDEDRAAARTALDQQFSDASGNSVFGDFLENYQQVLVDGRAAQSALAVALPDEDLGEDLLRRVYDANIEQFDGQEFEAVKEGIAEVLRQNPDLLFQATLVQVANGTDIYVDGRFGRFDATTGQIAPPEGADQPADTDTSIEDLLGSTAQ
jgi:hypothetical protein